MLTITNLENLLDQLGFDFSTFTIPNLVTHLEKISGRSIHLIPCQMDNELDGVWMTSKTKNSEYIFYDEHAPTHVREFILLHELSHLILGHKTIEFDPADVDQLRRNLILFPEQALTRSIRREEYEIEAEAMATLIWQKAEKAKHHQQMSDNPTNSSCSNLLKLIE